ncbi:MAG: ATP-dependent DNA helicase [Bacteroidales bacterium]|nr:ATP-dependent DNA helicase [Clostridium sp.]MCM1203216.1 ATP-dependent DNA helicase [Bacteroidales bacterium]
MVQMKISVRSLVEFIFRSGDITSGDGSFSKEAMQEGSRIHRKIQGKMGLNYEAEVPLKLDIVKPDYVLTIEGRADGIITGDTGVTIDEIKGVYKKLEYMEAPVFVHKAQAMCYAYIYALNHELDEITVQMTYCNLDTEEVKRFSEVFVFEELKAWFHDLVEEYGKWAQFDVDNRLCRNASIESLEFPYPYRAGQRDMAGTIYLSVKGKKNLFVQAPTGIGKTMAALYPAVKAMGDGYGEKLFYLTAKTIARGVALDGLEILRKNGLHFRSVLITAKEKICPLEKMDCEPENCPYAKGHYDRINEAVYACITHEANITRETLLEYAGQYMVCPFEMGLDVSLFVDGIICDYNYVFDPRVKLRRYFGEGAKGEFLFLVDEAHNLVERASAMYSAEIYKEDFLQMRKLLLPYHAKLGKLLGSCNRELLLYKKACDNEKRYALLEDIGSFYLKLLRVHAHLESFLEESREIAALRPHREEILNFYFQVNQFLNIYELMDESYEIYGEQISDTSFMVKLYCIHPAKNLTDCIEKGNATIFFSATMLPITYYKELLHNSEEDCAIYIPSPFPRENRGLFSGVDVSSRYKLRGPAQYEKMVRYLDAMVHSRTGNYMAFFPSYKLLRDVYDTAVKMGVLADVEIVCQDVRLSEEEREEFLGKFRSQGKPVLGFCILGGIFSEGIDLTGDALIGAAIIGTGLPMVCNEREILQQYFSRKEAKGFEYAYLYPGMNKVQQAAGRVIRTMEDRGVILLLDERFVTQQVVDTFPTEWEDYQVVTLDNVKQRLADFWNLASR